MGAQPHEGLGGIDVKLSDEHARGLADFRTEERVEFGPGVAVGFVDGGLQVGVHEVEERDAGQLGSQDFPRPKTSRPARVSGSDFTCIGNGLSIPRAARTPVSGSRTPRSAKDGCVVMCWVPLRHRNVARLPVGNIDRREKSLGKNVPRRVGCDSWAPTLFSNLQEPSTIKRTELGDRCHVPASTDRHQLVNRVPGKLPVDDRYHFQVVQGDLALVVVQESGVGSIAAGGDAH